MSLQEEAGAGDYAVEREKTQGAVSFFYNCRFCEVTDYAG